MPLKKDFQNVRDKPEMNVRISFTNLQESMTVFNGDDSYPIETFLDEFEDVAEVMKWSKIEKLVYAKRLLDGTAKLFLRSFGKVKDYTTLKNGLLEEFGSKINSAVIQKINEVVEVPIKKIQINNEEITTVIDSQYKEKSYRICEEYKPNEKVKESKDEVRIIVTDEDSVYESPKSLPLLEMDLTNKHIEESVEKKIIQPSKPDLSEPQTDLLKKDAMFNLDEYCNKEVVIPMKKAHEENEHDVKAMKTNEYKTKRLINKEYYIDRSLAKINRKNKDNYLRGILERKGITYFEGRRGELRVKTKSSIEKIQDVNIVNYRKRKKTRS